MDIEVMDAEIDENGEEWLTIGQLAKRTGESRVNIQRKITAKIYKAKKVNAPVPYWLIPMSQFTAAAVVTQDVVTVNQPISISELNAIIETRVAQAVASVTDKLLQDFEAQNKTTQIKLDELLMETRAERKAREKRGFLARILGL